MIKLFSNKAHKLLVLAAIIVVLVIISHKTSNNLNYDTNEIQSIFHDINFNDEDSSTAAQLDHLNKEEQTICDPTTFDNEECKPASVNDSESNHTNTLDETDETDSKQDYIDITKGDPRFHAFMSEYIDAYTESKQKLLHPNRPWNEAAHKTDKPGGSVFVSDPNVIISEEKLINVYNLPQDFIDHFKENHSKMLKKISNNQPSPFYKGSGYLFVGGGKFTWYSLLNIQALRAAGSNLPVEVLIHDNEDYDTKICEDVMPLYNAKCIKMSTVLGEQNLKRLNVRGFQYKSLALILSSFDNVFLLDADAFLVKNGDHLFNAEPFEKFGMISWPDFWRRATAPAFFEIAEKKVSDKPFRVLNDFYVPDLSVKYSEEDLKNPKTNLNFHDREGTPQDWSSETGQFLIRKSTHLDVLLLSLYYNLDGPQGYYPLFCQNTPGEGDKETWVNAANVLDKSYYAVNRKPWGAGTHRQNGRMGATTLVQSDFEEDFRLLEQLIGDRSRERVDEESPEAYDYEKSFSSHFQTKPLVQHIHSPKIDPFDIMKNKLTFDFEENHVRNLMKDENYMDLELQIYKSINKNLCEEKLEFLCFKDQDTEKLCSEFIPTQIEFLKSSTW